MPNGMIRFAPWMLVLTYTIWIVQPASAHPFHVCVGQMKWSAEGKYWEVSLRLNPHDLEQSMQKWKMAQSIKELEKGVPIEILLAGCRVEDPDFETKVVKYLQNHFFLRRAPLAMNEKELTRVLQFAPAKEEDFSKLVWVGKEYEKGWLWIYLEMHPPVHDRHYQRLWLCHQVLVGEVPNQENSIAVERSHKTKFALQFREGIGLRPFARTEASAINPLVSSGINSLRHGDQYSGPILD